VGLPERERGDRAHDGRIEWPGRGIARDDDLAHVEMLKTQA